MAVVKGSWVVIGREQRLVTTVVINRQRYLEGRYHAGGRLNVTASASPQGKPTVKEQPDVCRTAALWNNLIVLAGALQPLDRILGDGRGVPSGQPSRLQRQATKALECCRVNRLDIFVF